MSPNKKGVWVMRVYDYRIYVKEENRQAEMPAHFRDSLENAVRNRKPHPERKEQFEQKLVPLMQELAKRQRGILYLDVREESACARILIDGMLVLGSNDMELVQELLPYEIIISEQNGVVSLEVWVEFWDIAE